MRAYRMKTSRLGFSSWQEEGLQLAQTLWGDSQVTRLICASGSFTEEEIVRRYQTERENSQNYGIEYWPIYELATGAFVGCCGLRPHDMAQRGYELGFQLVPSQWGKGYATEAAKAVIVFATDVLRADYLFAGHNPRNTASKNALQKLGFVYDHDEYYEPTRQMHPTYLLKLTPQEKQ